MILLFKLLLTYHTSFPTSQIGVKKKKTKLSSSKYFARRTLKRSKLKRPLGFIAK